MRLSLVFTILILSVCGLFAQCNEYYPVKEGVKLEYDHFDKKDKKTVRTIMTFKDVRHNGTSTRAIMVQEIIDAKKNESVGTSESEWLCDNGVLKFTMNSMSMMEGMQQGEGMEVAVTGDKMDIPSDLKVGQKLNDMNYNIRMSMSGMNIMNRDFKVTDRKVEGEETITTPAGTFKCLKITFNTSSEKGLGAGTVKSTMWIAEDVGMVKSETYKEDGKVTSKQVLSKLTQS